MTGYGEPDAITWLQLPSCDSACTIAVSRNFLPSHPAPLFRTRRNGYEAGFWVPVP